MGRKDSLGTGKEELRKEKDLGKWMDGIWKHSTDMMIIVSRILFSEFHWVDGVGR